MSRPALLSLRQPFRQPFRQPRTTPWQRAADRLLGVSRRRRQLAYVAIGSGLAMLRPVFRRAAALTALVMVWTIGSVLF